MITTALKYRSMGLSVVPQKNKHPIIAWTEFQDRLPTEDEIKEWWTTNPDAGISAVVGSISNVIVVDCDSPEAVDVFEYQIPDSAIVPTAQTPRGGRHYYFSTDKAYQKCVGIEDKTDLQAEKSVIVMPPSNGPNGTPYSWIIEPTCFEDFPSIDILKSENKNSLYNKLKLYRENTTVVVNNTTSNYMDYNILQEGTRDNDLFKIGMALSDGKMPSGMIAQVLGKLALSANPPFPISEVNEKVKSIIKTTDQKHSNLKEEVKEWCLLQNGYYSTTEILQELQITTKEDKKYLTVLMVRLQENRIIEKYGEKRGVYRTIEKQGNREMGFLEDEIKEFDIKLPFGLNKICSLYAKNIVIVAGSKSAGKTALLMNIAMENQDKHEVVYFNSEMGVEEWSSRLRNMGVRKKSDVKMKAYGLHKNFQDMMDGTKKIFIVDYLEIHDNFYEIAKFIRLIHEVIEDGICIIAVQKKRGELLARGGDFSMEKSRLYLNLEFLEGQACSQITIVDAKSPKVPASLQGWSKRVKITGGAKMEALDKEWDK